MHGESMRGRGKDARDGPAGEARGACSPARALLRAAMRGSVATSHRSRRGRKRWETSSAAATSSTSKHEAKKPADVSGVQPSKRKATPEVRAPKVICMVMCMPPPPPPLAGGIGIGIGIESVCIGCMAVRRGWMAAGVGPETYRRGAGCERCEEGGQDAPPLVSRPTPRGHLVARSKARVFYFKFYPPPPTTFYLAHADGLVLACVGVCSPASAMRDY
jgi:hypothetical protein